MTTRIEYLEWCEQQGVAPSADAWEDYLDYAPAE